MSTDKVITSKTSNITAKVWMCGCFIIETAMTITTWAAIPLFFKIWSVIALMIDTFIVAREFILNPVKQRVAPGIYA